MKSKFARIDFEFRDLAEKEVSIVCCSITTDDYIYEYWVHLADEDDEVYQEMINTIIHLNSEGYIFVSHQVTAEAMCFISIGFKPELFKWICTFTESRCLSNHNHELQYGKHLINGEIKTLRKPIPKWAQNDKERKGGGKFNHSYSQVCYKFLDKIIDTERKDKMRNILINGTDEEVEAHRDEIQEYCTDDTKYLKPLVQKMAGYYKKYLPPEEMKTLRKEMLWRGETMARTAIMERSGYHINYEATKNFAANVPSILKDLQRDINGQFPEIKPFHLDKKTLLFTQKAKPINEWIENESGVGDRWLKTPTKNYSHSLDAFGEHFHFKHSYPRHNFGAQMLRYLKTKQNLNGFMPGKPGSTKKKFWDSVGSDGVVRSNLNPYGSQSARYQPAATGFIFLKAAWMRALVQPPEGKMYVGIDYKSEEFLIKGIQSQDRAMINAYKTGDVYLAYAKDSKTVPQEATKQTHPKERQSSKSTILGLQFDMTKYGLSKKLTNETDRVWDEDEAQEEVDKFNDTYYDCYLHKEEVLQNYQIDGYIKLPDGWYMWGDNPNPRSIGNCPTQGFGSCILRKAIQLSQDAGLDIQVPLHDAAYALMGHCDWESVKVFQECMREAFIYYFDDKESASLIMLDTECWGPGFEEVEYHNGIKCENIHIDERSLDEWETFKKYFNNPGRDLL